MAQANGDGNEEDEVEYSDNFEDGDEAEEDDSDEEEHHKTVHATQQ